MCNTNILIWLCIVTFSRAQLNGEFWWMNDKLANYQRVHPAPPKFENLSEFDNDESAKIVFSDDNLIQNSIVRAVYLEPDTNVENTKTNNSIDNELHFQNKSVNDILIEDIQQNNSTKTGDRFDFKFVKKDNFVWDKNSMGNKDNETTESAEEVTINTILYNDRGPLYGNSVVEEHSENICNFIKKSECYEKHGLVHNLKFAKKIYINLQLICCVFPVPNKNKYDPSKIYFPDDLEALKRSKRSNDRNEAQKQRNVLVKRRHTSHKTRSTTQRVATPDYEYNDPYWNVKSFKNTNKQPHHSSSSRYDYEDDEYVQDYVVEIPRPGLVDIYSDNTKKTSPWLEDERKVYGDSYDDHVDEDYSGSFGYSTIDPRLGADIKPKIKGKPAKLTTNLDEMTYNAESQTISYQSKPDFNVFQGFKLLNLMSNENNNRNKASRKSTTVDSIIEDESKEILNEGIDTSFDDDFEHRQVFSRCGNAMQSTQFTQDKQLGETVNGSHPWLVLVVLTKKRNTVLCYGTLIHPRAVVTAAHCVDRKPRGEITVITGLWDLNEKSRSKTRVVTVLLHPNYKHGNMSNDMALLHWTRPLKLSENVLPACLAEPHFGDDCLFFGWGGFDQAMRRRSRWQRASAHSCKGSVSLKNGDDVPNDAFCASVISRSTVTGTGGSLMCKTNGQLSAVGVAVSRDSTLMLLPLHAWVVSAISVLNEQ